MRYKILITAFLISLAGYNPLLAQNGCDCGAVFEKLVQKIEADYIGYALTKNEIEKEYAAHTSMYRELAKNSGGSSCSSLLQRFLEFFKDGHLFVSEIPNYHADELTVFKKSVKEKLFDIKNIHTYFTENKSSLYEIEGIWTDGESVYAIVKNKNKGWDFDFAAIILRHAQGDKIGELKMGLSRKEGNLEGTYYTNSYAPGYTTASLARENSLLSIRGGRFWGRLPYIDENSVTNAKLIDPKTPAVSMLDTETIILTIPTFLVDKKDFDDLLIANFKKLAETKYLIIDIRGNSGGNGIYFDLLSLFSDRPAPAQIGLALSSADNMAYFQNYGSGSVYAPVVKDMKNNMGKIVEGPRYSTIKIKPEKSSIQKVAIVTDEANMSAAESFILHAKGVSSKVITVGKNTKGVIDYQSVNMIKLECEKQGIYFGYPTSTSTKEVPKKGYNKTGIAPDVYTG